MIFVSGIKLDIGCGLKCKPGFVGVDIRKFSKDVKIVFDLNSKKRLPFKDNSIDEIYLAHVLEHLDNPIRLIEECNRVLKKGKLLEIHSPYFAYPHANVFIHKNYWDIFGCLRILNGEYHELNCSFSEVNWNYNWMNSKLYKLVEMFFDLIIKISPSFYEKRLSYIFPIYEVVFYCKK